MHGLNFDFQYMMGAFGCESTLQFSCIADLKSIQKGYEMIDTSEAQMEKTDYLSAMNDAIDNVLDVVYTDFPVRIEHYEGAYVRA